MPLPILPSVEHVLALGSHVRLHAERVAAAVSDWGNLLSPAQSWEHPCHFNDHSEETARWIFTLDALNHCFWPDPGEAVWTVRFEDGFYSGYWGLAASLKRALLSGVPITDPEYLSTIGEEDLRSIFSGEGTIPLLRERLQNLREAGRVILTRLDGDLATLLRQASGSAVRLVSDLVALFPSFRDDAFYRGRPVYFWKRAQIFASDLHAAFGGKSWGKFEEWAISPRLPTTSSPRCSVSLASFPMAPDSGQRSTDLNSCFRAPTKKSKSAPQPSRPSK